MDLTRLLRPASIAVVGASERPGSYGAQTLLNLDAIGFEGEVVGVNPRRTTVHGRPCEPGRKALDHHRSRFEDAGAQTQRRDHAETPVRILLRLVPP